MFVACFFCLLCTFSLLTPHLCAADILEAVPAATSECSSIAGSSLGGSTFTHSDLALASESAMQGQLSCMYPNCKSSSMCCIAQSLLCHAGIESMAKQNMNASDYLESKVKVVMPQVLHTHHPFSNCACRSPCSCLKKGLTLPRTQLHLQ